MQRNWMMPGKKIEEAYVKEQEIYAQGKVDEIRTAAENQKSKLVWETVNEFTGRRVNLCGRL